MKSLKCCICITVKIQQRTAQLVRISAFFLALSLIPFYTFSQFNPGLENTSSGTPGWTFGATFTTSVTWSVISTNVRTGGRKLNASTATTNARDYDHTGYTVLIPAAGTNYVHVIGYYRATNATTDRARVSAISPDGGTNVNGTLANVGVVGSFVRYTVSGVASNGKTYYPRVEVACNTSLSGRNHGFDDFIIYTSTNSGVDLSAPNSPSGLCINSSGSDNILTWTDGTDNASNTSGIDGVMILRAPAGTALPTINDQGYYSLDNQIGPAVIGSWTVLHNSSSTGSFTDPGAAGNPYIYAVYMRDVAFNYSAPITFQTANAGTDQSLACNVFNTSFSATSASGGYTGTWSVYSGNGTFGAVNSATSTVSSLGGGSNTFAWTVSNGSCSTIDYVTINTSSTTPSQPVTVYPTNGATNINSSPSSNLQWTNGGGALTYNVYFGTTSPGILVQSNTSLTNYGTGNLAPSTTYFWRIDAINVCGTTTGTVQSFTTLPNFSNTTAQACGTDYTNTFGNFTRNISVSGLPTPLGNAAGQYVLNEIDVKLGSPGCMKNLSTYDFRLTSPNGTNLDFITNLTSTISNVWLDGHFRDNAALERINEYATASQNTFYPYAIGYYAVDTDNSFQSVFNGEDPNGTWVLSIKEAEAAGNEISFVSVTLKFGPAIQVNDVTANSANNNCAGATCLDMARVVVGTNNGYSQTDPNFPGTTVNGCSWNGANNNSAWFTFTASATSAYITVSGNANTASTGNSDTQPIILTAPASCTAPTVVPTGGCPDDASINNTSYLTANGGGAGTNPYVNGISANAEFNLSGLTVGQKYYLYIDGNGGISSSFYIEGISGLQTMCNITPLAIEWVHLSGYGNGNSNVIEWTAKSDATNINYELEYSYDGKIFYLLENDFPENNYDNKYTYSHLLNDSDLKQKYIYYRVKASNENEYSYSETVLVESKNEDFIGIYPNPASDVLTIIKSGKEKITDIQIFTVDGRQIGINYMDSIQSNTKKINLSGEKNGIYFIKILQENNCKTFKFSISR